MRGQSPTDQSMVREKGLNRGLPRPGRGSPARGKWLVLLASPFPRALGPSGLGVSQKGSVQWEGCPPYQGLLDWSPGCNLTAMG